jgi:hypothetical protein
MGYNRSYLPFKKGKKQKKQIKNKIWAINKKTNKNPHIFHF